MNKEELRTSLEDIASLRKQGDGMVKLNKQDLALGLWRQALKEVESLMSRLTQETSAEDRAEVFGVRGGLLKRLGDDAGALESYRQGAAIEAEAELGSTYNRMNAIRTALLLKATTLKLLEPELVAVSSLLEKRLEKPEAASEGWSWADLGDVYTLLGKAVEAEKNYRAYARIAGGEEVRITREALDLLLTRLTEAKDPNAGRISAGLEVYARATRPSDGLR